MPMTIEEALSELGVLKGKVGPLETEVGTLRTHKEKLESDLAKVKEKRDAAESEATALKEKVPADGSLVLNKADAARWGVLSGIASELGGVDKVQGRLARVTELEQASAKQARENTIRAAGYDPKKLERILGGAEFKVTGEGDEAKAFVVSGETETALDKWAETEDVTDLLNVARLSPDAKRNETFTGAGTRKGGEFKALSAEERAKQKKNESRYSGI